MRIATPPPFFGFDSFESNITLTLLMFVIVSLFLRLFALFGVVCNVSNDLVCCLNLSELPLREKLK